MRRSILIPTLLTLLLAVVSCQQGARHHSNSSAQDSILESQAIDNIDWRDSTLALCTKANDYFNHFQLDTLELFVPEAMKVCIEHNQIKQYYDLWSALPELYFAKEDFEKGFAEAKRMQDDALSRHDGYGLYMSYKLIGLGYAFSDNIEESVKFLRKAIDSFPKGEEEADLLTTYTYLYQTLDQLEEFEAIDTVMTEWKGILDHKPVVKTGTGFKGPNLWHFEYQALLAKHLMTVKKDLQAASEALDSAEYYLGDAADPIHLERLYYIRGALAREQGHYAESLSYIDRYEKTADELGDNSSKKVALFERSLTFETFRNYQDALTAYKQFSNLKDSLTNVDDREKLAELNKRFEVAELKLKNERQQMQAERHQHYLIILIVLIVLVTVIMFAYFKHRHAKRMAEMKAAQERIESELRIARDIQMSMVPSTFPDQEGLDMYASMTPAKEVGGDLYGYVHMGNKLYIAVGDVSGKGVPASLFMAQATRLFRTLATQSMMPAEICTRMNDALSGEDNESSMFVTFWLGLVDLQTGHLHFCNAGHNPPVIGNMPSSPQEEQGVDSPSFLDMQSNAPIGLWSGLEYEGEEIESIKGRTLFIYTDGLNEAENRQQERFGDDRLLDILRTTRFDSAQQVIDTLKAAVDAHRDGAEPNDDLTMMCVRIN